MLVMVSYVSSQSSRVDIQGKDVKETIADMKKMLETLHPKKDQGKRDKVYSQLIQLLHQDAQAVEVSYNPGWALLLLIHFSLRLCFFLL